MSSAAVVIGALRVNERSKGSIVLNVHKRRYGIMKNNRRLFNI